jgi:glycosyltransferase involved in cell wall biosynthesis
MALNPKARCQPESLDGSGALGRARHVVATDDGDANARRIGYLVPEFPGQTHVFFWREVRALATMGIDVDLVSTRRPATDLISHPWAAQAMPRTFYLMPLGLRGLLGATRVLLAAGPHGWRRCLTAIADAEDRSLSKRMRMMLLIPVGAKLAWAARRRGWKHLQVHSCGDSANAAMFARLLVGTRYGLTLHSPLSFFGPNQRHKWRNADLAFFVARAIRDEAVAILGANVPPVLETVPMGVDVKSFSRISRYVAYSGIGPCRIFSCGRLNLGKGHLDLVRAMGKLRQLGIDARLRIAGEDDSPSRGFRPRIERLIDELMLAEHVALLGAVSEERVKDELESAHLFALASHEEALGVATMEAMAMRVPVVVTRVGGVPELVGDGVEGLLVPPHEPDALAAAMARVLRDKDLAVRLGEAGRGKVERAFHSSLSAELLVRHVLGDAGACAVA